MAASPSATDIDLARARLLVARADQAKKKSKATHKGTKATADKENEDLQAKKKKVVSVAYVACHFRYVV